MKNYIITSKKSLVPAEGTRKEKITVAAENIKAIKTDLMSRYNIHIFGGDILAVFASMDETIASQIKADDIYNICEDQPLCLERPD